MKELVSYIKVTHPRSMRWVLYGTRLQSANESSKQQG